MSITLEHLDDLMIYFGILFFAAPLLLWLFFRAASPTVAPNGTAKSLDDRMVPISHSSLHHPGEVRHGQERRLAQDRRSYQVNASAI